MSKTTVRKGKQDDKFSLAIREIQGSIIENKKCFDCEQRGPTYVNTTVGSFVCTKCSGMLRGMNPPHRIKSISMSTFTADEVELMRWKGNLWCSRAWLANYDRASHPVDYKDDEKIKEFMIAKYERKRYYGEPTERTMLPRSSPSASSISSTCSQDKPLSSLIGTTLKAHMIAQSQGSGASIAAAVSRPNHQALPRPQEARIPPQIPAQLPAQIPAQLPAQISAQLPAQPTQPQAQNNDFANFADFDSVAFDSLPADPLSTASTSSFPTNTLPPMKTVSQVTNNNTLSQMGPPPKAAAVTVSQGDRYSALKELDDLFKTTTIQSPVGVDPLPEPSLFGSAPAPIPKTNGGLFSDLNGGGGLFPEANGRNSPAGWASTAAPAAWTPAWNNGGGGWPASADSGWGGAGGTGSGGHSTNPFGTSPSGQPGANSTIPENNNDLFAAAPKPFITQKQGFEASAGNPWSGVPVFTPNMTPAHNPHNPFL